jgi:hypothetical protein
MEILVGEKMIWLQYYTSALHLIMLIHAAYFKIYFT